MTRDAGELLPGTFEMLMLKALSLGAMHGWGVAERIERLSGGVCEIQQGAVYPVLQRLLRRGWVVADWRSTENQLSSESKLFSCSRSSSARVAIFVYTVRAP